MRRKTTGAQKLKHKALLMERKENVAECRSGDNPVVGNVRIRNSVNVCVVLFDHIFCDWRKGPGARVVGIVTQGGTAIRYEFYHASFDPVMPISPIGCDIVPNLQRTRYRVSYLWRMDFY